MHTQSIPVTKVIVRLAKGRKRLLLSVTIRVLPNTTGELSRVLP